MQFTLRQPLSLAFLLGAATPLGLAGQERAVVSGVVLNAVTGQPISAVRVAIVGSEMSTRTDEAGQFLIEDVPPGLVKVIAQSIGYHPITTPYYTLKPEQAQTVNFKLAPLQVQLEPLEVVGEETNRDNWAFNSRILRQEDLPSRGNIINVLQSVVAGVRGVGRRETQGLSVRGSFADVLYVLDGVVVKPPFQFYVDASEVACVEVRRGTMAATEFRPSNVGELYGGVVLIWTKASSSPRPRECRTPN